jgi:hypothetical protein
LARLYQTQDLMKEVIGQATFQAVKSDVGCWYLVLPDVEDAGSWLKFVPRDRRGQSISRRNLRR